MTKLEELIIELCPNEVEFITLGDIGDVCMCKRILKEQTKPIGDVPFFKIGTFGKEPDAFISQELFNKYRKKYSFPKIGDILISAAGTIGRTVTYDGEPAYFQDSNIVWIDNDETKILNKFLSYFYSLQPWAVSAGGTIARLYNGNIRKTVIPLPPLAIQREIVRILDNFTELTAVLTVELTAELTARKKQYKYYRDQLLTFGDDVPMVALGEIAECFAGATPQTTRKEYWEKGTIPWMSSGEVNLGQVYDTEKKITQIGYDKCSTKMVPANTVVVALAGQGKTRGMVAITRIPLCTNQSLCSIVPKEKLNSNYLNYYLKTQYQKLRLISSGDGTRGGLNLKMIKDYSIPLPPLSEQARIVAILDKFDALTADIANGLPAEIEARRKQYEYYRDKLLTFKEVGV
jgi:type I restriction enzyme S subunit